MEAAREPRLLGNRYLLEALLGRGGMGAVYRALDTTTGDRVALKVLGSAGEGEASQPTHHDELRFQREFHTLARLHHPRIVEAFDYGSDPAGSFYTMELLDGLDLKQLTPMAPKDVCRVLRDVAAALAFLHARGLVHRDLSPRNVRVGSDSAVKLIDFGVLATVGATAELAGTPNYTAPETVYGRLLDGRTDLYALGALGYALLTARPPYPSRSFANLREVWRDPLAPPSRFAPSVGEALDELVLELLCLNPLGRPASAAVVMDRLTAIGELERDPTLEVSRGYLASAAMVGRRREMAQLRDGIDRAAHGGIASSLVEAPSGTGKSRLLRELALEAKLAGAVVAIANCEEVARGPYGAISELLHAVYRSQPALLEHVPRSEAGKLLRVMPWLDPLLPDVEASEPAPDPAEERMRVQRAIASWVLTFALQQMLVLLVDDVQRADEASAAVLASLARHSGSARLYLVNARRTLQEVRAPEAVASLAEAGRRVVLSGLDEKETQELVRSFFGDISGTSKLAHWMHGFAGGSPLLCGEIARYLVDVGEIRYADGVWVLPTEIDSEQLPDGLMDAMRGRVGRMSPEARALGEVLAIHGGAMPLRTVVDLAEEPVPALVFSALDELAAEGVLLESGGSFSFRHDGLREALLAGIDDERRGALHLAVGRYLSDAYDAAEREAEIGWHLLHGGDEAAGAELLERAGTQLYQAQALRDCLPPIEAALAVYREQGLPTERCLPLLYMLLAAGWVADRTVGARYALEAVRAFRKHAGIDTAEKASRVLGKHVGLVTGISTASMRWLTRFGDKRGPTPASAVVSFAVALGYACGLTYSANRREDVEELVALAEPMAVFKRRIPYAAYLGMQTFPAIITGRLGVAERYLTRALEIIENDTLTPATDWDRRFAEAGLRGLRVIIDVNQFNPRLYGDLERIDQLGFRYYQLVVQTARVVHHRYRGEEDRALEVQRALETDSLQLGSWSTDLQILLFAHPAYALTDDLIGLKRCGDQLRHFVREGFRFEDRAAMVEAEQHRIRGEAAEGLAIAEEWLARTQEDNYLMRQWIGSTVAESALATHDWQRASQSAAEVIALGENDDHGILLPRLRAERVKALADYHLGEVNAANQRLSKAIALVEGLDCPVLAGSLHDARARIGLAGGDRLSYEVHSARSAEWIHPTRNPPLIARLERLHRLGTGDASQPGDVTIDAGHTDSETVAYSPSTRSQSETETKRH